MERIPVGDFRLGEEEKLAIQEVLDSGRISEGAKVKEFEEHWAKFVGTKEAIALSSGTAALICGLSALKHHSDYNLREGQKVITTPLTYIATSNAIVLSNLEPVFVDVSLQNFNIEPENIQAELEKAESTGDFALILPVHLMGFPCDMEKIGKIAKRFSLPVFEDSAQAHGTTINGKKTGSFGLLSDFSFYIAHNIQAGELGAINTNDKEIARLARKIKANGRACDCKICTRNTGKCPQIAAYKGKDDFDPRFSHDLIGYNFKAMEFQAALAITQLKKADWITKRRQENVKYLNDSLQGFSELLQLPEYSKEVSYLAYPITIKNPKKISRKELRKELEKRGIETRPLFGCIPTQQPAYSFLKEKYPGKLPNAEYLGMNSFYIGCHQYLEEKELEQIVKAFKEILS